MLQKVLFFILLPPNLLNLVAKAQRLEHSSRDCSLPHSVVGPCRALFFKWTHTPQGCVKFGYGGCEGNNNRFDSLDECTRFCGEGMIIEAPSAGKMTSPGMKRPKFPGGPKMGFGPKAPKMPFGGPKLGGPKSGIINPRGAIINKNNPSIPLVTIDDCLLPMNRGTGTASMIRRFYYNKITRKCEPFSWTRVGGNLNRFVTFQMCQEICARKMEQYFNIVDVDSGISDESVEKIENELFQKEEQDRVNRIESNLVNAKVPGKLGKIAISGPNLKIGNPTGKMSKIMNPKCRMKPAVQGSSNTFRKYRRYTYYPEKNECGLFMYKGQGGNQNNFFAKIGCEAQCKLNDEELKIRAANRARAEQNKIRQQAMLNKIREQAEDNEEIEEEFEEEDQPLDNFTRCSSAIPSFNDTASCFRQDSKSFFYRKESNRCEFVYDCGTHNNGKQLYFDNLETCEDNCIDQARIFEEFEKIVAQQDKLFQKSESKGSNKKMEDMLLNIQTQEYKDMIELKPSQIDKCQIDAKPGHCQHKFQRYYYDYKTNSCKSFVYTGCGGNENNFKTPDECHDSCYVDSPQILPETKDVVEGEVPDSFASDTEVDIYADEKFSSSMMANLIFEKACNKTLDIGLCNVQEVPRYSVKFYWDSVERRCKPFRYTGCGGNENRFHSLQKCEHTCGTLKNIEPFNQRCLNHHESGPCEATISRWRWNVETGQCEQFFWYGCMLDGVNFNGNRNNFMNKNDCECHCLNPDSCISKCQVHETYHFNFLGMDEEEQTSYKSIVCRNLNSTIGDLIDLVKEHEDVEFLDIRNNQLNSDDMQVLKYALELLPMLRVALLGGNQLYDHLNELMFQRNGRLQYLDISNGGIKEFAKTTFDYLTSLKHLNMSNNHLTYMYPDQFELLVDLKYLDISHNDISHLKAPQLQSNYNLAYLNLAYNNFTELPKVFLREQTNLKQIILDHNPFDNGLAHSEFKYCKDLDYVSMAHCKNLKNLPNGLFGSNLRLMTVKLDGNDKMAAELARTWAGESDIQDLRKWLHFNGEIREKKVDYEDLH